MRIEMTSDPKANLRLIRQVINDAMSTKDKYVTINMLGGNFTSINVYPISEDEGHWIAKSNVEGDSPYHCRGYICSECGMESQFTSPYCPMCGEKLKQPVREVK